MSASETDPKAAADNPREDWPNTVCSRDELDSALEAGLASGKSDRTFDDIIDAAKKWHGIE